MSDGNRVKFPLWEALTEFKDTLIDPEIDAAVFKLYNLDVKDITHIMSSFPMVKNKDENEYDEYKTYNKIKEIYNRYP